MAVPVGYDGAVYLGVRWGEGLQQGRVRSVDGVVRWGGKDGRSEVGREVGEE